MQIYLRQKQSKTEMTATVLAFMETNQNTQEVKMNARPIYSGLDKTNLKSAHFAFDTSNVRTDKQM